MNWAMIDAIGIWVVAAMLVYSGLQMVRTDRATRAELDVIRRELDTHLHIAGKVRERLDIHRQWLAAMDHIVMGRGGPAPVDQPEADRG